MKKDSFISIEKYKLLVFWRVLFVNAEFSTSYLFADFKKFLKIEGTEKSILLADFLGDFYKNNFESTQKRLLNNENAYAFLHKISIDKNTRLDKNQRNELQRLCNELLYLTEQFVRYQAALQQPNSVPNEVLAAIYTHSDLKNHARSLQRQVDTAESDTAVNTATNLQTADTFQQLHAAFQADYVLLNSKNLYKNSAIQQKTIEKSLYTYVLSLLLRHYLECKTLETQVKKVYDTQLSEAGMQYIAAQLAQNRRVAPLPYLYYLTLKALEDPQKSHLDALFSALKKPENTQTLMPTEIKELYISAGNIAALNLQKNKTANDYQYLLDIYDDMMVAGIFYDEQDEISPVNFGNYIDTAVRSGNLAQALLFSETHKEKVQNTDDREAVIAYTTCFLHFEHGEYEDVQHVAARAEKQKEDLYKFKIRAVDLKAKYELFKQNKYNYESMQVGIDTMKRNLNRNEQLAAKTKLGLFNFIKYLDMIIGEKLAKVGEKINKEEHIFERNWLLSQC